MQYFSPSLILFLAITMTSLASIARAYDGKDVSSVASNPANTRQYTFAWQYLDGGVMAPRGGTTTGVKVELATKPSLEWKALQEPNLSRKEKDRRAILAMAGPYRTSFDFIETVGFNVGYEPAAPYQSWGTEYVYVIADEPDFISLQNIQMGKGEAFASRSQRPLDSIRVSGG